MKFTKILFVTMIVGCLSASAWARRPMEYTPQQLEALGKAGDDEGIENFELNQNKQVIPYLPRDIRLANHYPLTGCGENGLPTDDATRGCRDYLSSSTNTRWRVAFIESGGTAERIFKVTERSVILHVIFNVDNLYLPLYVSQEAETYARATSGNSPQLANHDYSAPSAPPQQARCGDLDMLARLACEMNNNAGVGGVIGGAIKGIGR